MPNRRDAYFKLENEIKGFPRYMLLDASGNIVAYNALPPSDDRIKQQIDSLLQLK